MHLFRVFCFLDFSWLVIVDQMSLPPTGQHSPFFLFLCSMTGCVTCLITYSPSRPLSRFWFIRHTLWMSFSLLRRGGGGCCQFKGDSAIYIAIHKRMCIYSTTKKGTCPIEKCNETVPLLFARHVCNASARDCFRIFVLLGIPATNWSSTSGRSKETFGLFTERHRVNKRGGTWNE